MKDIEKETFEGCCCLGERGERRKHKHAFNENEKKERNKERREEVKKERKKGIKKRRKKKEGKK
jgi:hypothetical protein